MNSTPNVKHPSVRRVNRAYVDVPPSPLTSAARRASGHVILSNSRLKENAPMQPQQVLGTSPMSSLKRKLVDHGPSLVFDAVIMPTKRAKSSASPNSATLNGMKIQGTDSVMAKTVTDEFPDGFIYCHQCNKKRDSKHAVTCTVVFKYTSSAGDSKERTCKCKYCMQCLKNRYNENIGTYKSQSPTSVFKCPRCRGICNCYRCRKLKDAGVTSNPGAVKSTDAKGLTGAIANENTKAKVNEPKQLPLLKWQRIPLSLTQDEVDQRILIREFVFRFADCLEPSIAKIHMEDLEILTRSKTYEDDEGTFWVNDLCLRVIVMGLLGLLSQDCDDDIGRLIKIASKDLQAGGVNLNKLWAILSSLRASVTRVVSASPSTSHSKIFLGFPDPLPPSASALTARSLRSMRVPTDTINVVQSSQMIPVVVSLVQSALETQIIREEIDQGSKDNKDVLRNAKEAIRVENERWEKEKTAIEVGVKDKARQAQNRDKRAAHKDQITNIENALKLVTSTFAPRFMPLGTDNIGRVYYALSPGVAEREAALEYLEAAADGRATKLKKKGRVLSVEERTGMRDWSWFVAVWGTKHPSLPNAAQPLTEQNMKVDEEDRSDEEGVDDETASKWWGFWDAEEITKLADFVSITSGVEDEVGSSSGRETSSAFSTKRKQPRMEQWKKLTGALREYAKLLQWRAHQDKFMLLR